MRKLLYLFLLIFSLSTLSACSKSSGFKSSEQAADAFLTALQNHNVEKILDCFAIEPYLDNIDLDTMVNNLRYYDISHIVPENNDMARSLNIETRKNEITRQLKFLYFKMIESTIDRSSYVKQSETSSDEFLNDLFPKRKNKLDISYELNSISVKKILSKKNPDLYDIYTEYKEQEDKIYTMLYSWLNADEIETICSEITVDNKDYYLILETVKYGDKWYILKLGGRVFDLLGGSNSSGLIPVDEL